MRAHPARNEPTEETAPRRRLRPVERRRQIVDAAVQLLHTTGPGRVSLRDIAAAAGVSIGTVTYHFAKVDDIIDLALAQEVTEYYQRLHERIVAEPDPCVALRLLADACFTEETAQHWRLWFETLGRGDTEAELRAQRERYAQWAGTIQTLVESGVASGAFRCSDIPEAVSLIVALVDGLSLRQVRGQPATSFLYARRYFRDAVSNILALPSEENAKFQ